MIENSAMILTSLLLSGMYMTWDHRLSTNKLNEYKGLTTYSWSWNAQPCRWQPLNTHIYISINWT